MSNLGCRPVGCWKLVRNVAGVEGGSGWWREGKEKSVPPGVLLATRNVGLFVVWA